MSNMVERRDHKRYLVDCWASLRHPELGTVTADIRNISSSGLSLTLDEEMNFSVPMELDVKVHGEGWDESMPALPVQVVRAEKREVALRFLDDADEHWILPLGEDFMFAQADEYMDDDRHGLRPAAI